MTATASPDGRLPSPLYIDAAGTRCFGWFHGSAGGGLPVLMCGSVGAEDLATHAVLRDVAQRLTAGGQSCLRLDWPGAGDSAPLPDGADAWPHWLAAVPAAVEALRAATGAPRVAVLGLRLGASIAWQALQDRADIAAFVAWSPVVQGRALLREWRMLGAGGLASLAHEDGSLETGGIHVSGATCASIGRLKLDGPPSSTAPTSTRLLVIDRDDLPTTDRWCAALRDAGVAVDAQRLPGLDGLMAVAHRVVTPIAMIDAAVGWLQAASRTEPAVPTLQAVPPRGRLVLNEVAHSMSQPGTPAVVEWPLWLDGDGPPLLALRAEPLQPQDGPLTGSAVLVLNTGAERRTGPHGQFVALARHWAAQGACVLRLDLAGLGDSPAITGETPSRVYPPRAMDDLQRALAYVRGLPGTRRTVVLGLCSGGFHAFEAAVQGLDVDLAVAINPLVFVRPESEDFDAVPAQAHAVQQLSGEAVRNLRDPARWAKLLRGEVNWRFISATLARRGALALQRALRAVRRGIGQPAPDDVAARLAAAVSVRPTGGTQTRLCLVFAEQDPGLAMLQAEAGSAAASLQRSGRLQVHTIAGADHTFSRSAHRAALRVVLDDVLGAGVSCAERHIPQTDAGADSAMRRARYASASST